VRFASLALGLALALHGLPAGAQQSLAVGLYAPEVPIDPYQRFAYAQALARHLGKALGVPVSAHAYKSAADLRRDVQRKKIGFAVLGGFFLASYRVPASRLLGFGTMSSPRQLVWSLCAKAVAPLGSLRGRTLQLPSLGPAVHGLVEHGLLGGNLELKKHFRIVESPDLTSALEAVRLDQAGLVFAPLDSKGLRPLLPASLQVPPPAFVQLDPGLPPEQVRRAAQALLGFKGVAGSLAGWSSVSPLDYTRFASLARKRTPRMELVDLPHERLQVTDLVAPGALGHELPGLDEHFQVP
jgi:hypothetical protein